MGEMVVLRDPLGLRPLCYAVRRPAVRRRQRERGAAQPRVQGHQLARARRDGPDPRRQVSVHRFAPQRRPAHCFFEWIYFANVASTLDDRSVYLSRARLGQELARQERALGLFDSTDGNTVVVPVPDTGKAAADAMAFELGIPSRRGADPQPVRRPDVHRGRQPGGQGPAEVHPAAGGAGRQAGDPGRGLDRPQHDAQEPAQLPEGAGRGGGGPRSRRLPADRRPVLLRHRHDHGEASCTPRSTWPGRADAGRAGGDGPGPGGGQPGLPAAGRRRPVRRPAGRPPLPGVRDRRLPDPGRPSGGTSSPCARRATATRAAPYEQAGCAVAGSGVRG